jgi:hypothetical protein
VADSSSFGIADAARIIIRCKTEYTKNHYAKKAVWFIYRFCGFAHNDDRRNAAVVFRVL